MSEFDLSFEKVGLKRIRQVALESMRSLPIFEWPDYVYPVVAPNPEPQTHAYACPAH